MIAYHIIANAQKMGGFTCYLDVERALHKEFVQRMGVNWEKLFRPKDTPSTIEGTFDLIEKMINVARTHIPDRSKPVVICIDSIAALVAKDELEIAYEDHPAMGLEARAMSRGLRKLVPALDAAGITLLCINQLREKIGSFGFGDPDIAPHGKALPFYASVRLKLKSIGQIKITKTGQVIGVKTEASVFKNKVGPGHRKALFPLYYDWGVGNEVSLMDYLIDIEEIKGTTWKTWSVGDQDYRWQGTETFVDLMKKPEVQKYVADLIEKNMVYSFDRRPDDIQIDLESSIEVQQLKDSLAEKN